MPETLQRRRVRPYPGGELTIQWLEVSSARYFAFSGRLTARLLLPAGPSFTLEHVQKRHWWQRVSYIELGRQKTRFQVFGDPNDARIKTILERAQETLSQQNAVLFNVACDGRSIRLELERRSYTDGYQGGKAYAAIMDEFGDALVAMATTDLYGIDSLLALPGSTPSWSEAGPPVVVSRACPDVRYTVEVRMRKVRCVVRYRAREIDTRSIPPLPPELKNGKLSVKGADAEFRFPGVCRDEDKLLAAGRFLRSLGSTHQPYR